MLWNLLPCVHATRLSRSIDALGALSPLLGFALLCVVKAGKLLAFLCVRVVASPVVVGTVLGLASVPLLGSSVAAHLAWARSHTLFFLLMHWGVGMTFFLVSLTSWMQVGIFLACSFVLLHRAR